jgi:hypothetical protein
MVITDFADKFIMYENYAIWTISSLDEFMKSHEKLSEIFEKEYGVPFDQRNNVDSIDDNDLIIISNLLDYFDDKQFFIFSNNDKHHNDLKKLQDEKKINFGMDIYVLQSNKIYILEMDKTQDLKKYDT